MQQPSRILAEKSGKRVQMQFICIIFVAIKLKSYVLLNQTRRFNTQKRIRTRKKKQKDKARANYYSFYSGKKWGLADNYDLCINSTHISTEQAVEIILSYLNILDKK